MIDWATIIVGDTYQSEQIVNGEIVKTTNIVTAIRKIEGNVIIDSEPVSVSE